MMMHKIKMGPSLSLIILALIIDPVYIWRTKASAERRQDMLKVIQSGKLDITAFPFSIEPFLNKSQWDQMLHWIPDSLWKSFHPGVGVLDDVNGCPSSAAVALLDRNLKHL